MPQQLLDELDAFAGTLQLSRADLVRRLLADGLARSHNTEEDR